MLNDECVLVLVDGTQTKNVAAYFSQERFLYEWTNNICTDVFLGFVIIAVCDLRMIFFFTKDQVVLLPEPNQNVPDKWKSSLWYLKTINSLSLRIKSKMS